MASFTVKRSTVKRDVRRNVAAKTASEAIGMIRQGCEIFGVNKGQFSLVDIIAHCLEATGPASVICSTWTAAGADMGFAMAMISDGRITDLRFIVDFSFPTRQPEYCAALRERFGDRSIRLTKTHAKFVLIQNERWNIVIRSSMNLNENRRLESFEISDSIEMARFLQELVAELFDEQPATEGFEQRPYDLVTQFEGLCEGGILSDPQQKSTDMKYFGAGRYSQDLRRAGVCRG